MCKLLEIIFKLFPVNVKLPQYFFNYRLTRKRSFEAGPQGCSHTGAAEVISGRQIHDNQLAIDHLANRGW